MKPMRERQIDDINFEFGIYRENNFLQLQALRV